MYNFYTKFSIKTILLFSIVFTVAIGHTQSLPIDFETTIVTADFVDFDGGIGTVIANPQPNGINTSSTVAQIVRDGGAIWAGSKILLANNLDFSTLGIISMKVFTTAPVGTTVKFKLEGNGATEVDVLTTTSNEWETLTWDFTGVASNFNEIVFMFDFGNTGDGSETSTFLFDDIEQVQGLAQIDWPVDFEGSTINYTVTDFDGPYSELTADPTDASNTVIKTIKPVGSGASSGTTIGRPSGFATNLPLSLSSSKMNIRVWSPDAGTPVRLKVEDSNDPTHTCETETNTTLTAEWETIEFDFSNQAPGTESLSVGLSQGWTYNMASIFFNFGTDGATAGEKTYYFDDVKFGAGVVGVNDFQLETLNAYPNPTNNYWTISNESTAISSIEIFDMNGKLIQLTQPKTHTTEIDANSFVKGIYISKITTDLGISYIKLVKN